VTVGAEHLRSTADRYPVGLPHARTLINIKARGNRNHIKIKSESDVAHEKGRTCKTRSQDQHMTTGFSFFSKELL
jgi:hypothetical protein